MKAWKKLVFKWGTGGSGLVPPMPSRLLTDDDLKPFYEEMKISEVTNSVVVHNNGNGIKRKSEYLGGLDTQQYGRGKRAREVRSYEEQWTEEEFEKLCQVESLELPKPKEDVIEKKLPTVAGPVMVIAETEAPAPAQIPLPPQMTQLPPVEPQIQRSTAVTPPLKRGRGRPKRVTTEISCPATNLPAPSGASKVDVGSQQGNVTSSVLLPGPDSLPSSTSTSISTPMKNITGTIQPFGWWISSTSQSIPPSISPPPITPALQPSAATSTSVLGQSRGRGRKTKQVGVETPRRGGRKQNVMSLPAPVPLPPSVPGLPVPSVMAFPVPAVPVLPAPSATALSAPVEEVIPASSVAGKPDTVSQDGVAATSNSGSVSSSTTLKHISEKLVPVETLRTVPPASSASRKFEVESQIVVPVSVSLLVPGSSIGARVSGTVHDSGTVTAVSSKQSSVQPYSDSGYHFTPSCSVSGQGRGRGRKAQSGTEAP